LLHERVGIERGLVQERKEHTDPKCGVLEKGNTT
jgi:hypothetical protein